MYSLVCLSINQVIQDSTYKRSSNKLYHFVKHTMIAMFYAAIKIIWIKSKVKLKFLKIAPNIRNKKRFNSVNA